MHLNVAAFGLFKVMLRRRVPRKSQSEVQVAAKIVKNTNSVPQKWVDHLNETYQEIIDGNGAGTHYMSNL